MTTLSITKHIELRWQIKGTPYRITKDGRVFNIRTGREKKRTVNGSTIGYWMGRKFHSLNAINAMTEKIKHDKCPF